MTKIMKGSAEANGKACFSSLAMPNRLLSSLKIVKCEKQAKMLALFAMPNHNLPHLYSHSVYGFDGRFAFAQRSCAIIRVCSDLLFALPQPIIKLVVLEADLEQPEADKAGNMLHGRPI